MDIEIKLATEHVNKSKEEILLILEAELDKFSTYMSNLSDWRARGSLNSGERALLKTYLVNKIKISLNK
jgi:hypothetical protein